MENDSFNQPPCCSLESVNHQKGSLGEGGRLFLPPSREPIPPQQDEKARLCRRKLTVTSFDPLPPKETTKKTTRQWPRSGRVSSTPGLLIRTEGGPREGLSSLFTDAGVCSQSFSLPSGGLLFFLLTVYGTTECDSQLHCVNRSTGYYNQHCC